jgi:uncharacterized protein (TIGR03435 family)
MPIRFLILASTAALFAQTPVAFEVASVKPSAPNQRGYGIVPEPGGGLKVRNAPLALIIGEAFAVQSFQLSGVPSWANSARYDIDARAADPQADKRQLRQMLESLLADRFRLAVHRETRDLPVYSLVAARSGPKLTRAADAAGPHGVDFRDGGLIIIGRAATMEEFAQALSFRVGRRVTDRTGLDGRYDFRVEFTPDEAIPRFGDEHPPAGDPDGSSLFTALQEQIGLRLQAAKGPVEIVVVDKVERPTEN